MRMALTGTPGTGKTTVAELVDADLDVVHLNDLVEEADLHVGRDDERGSLVADLEAIEAHLADRDDVLVESHLSHHLRVDRVVVLRCHPRELRERLMARDDHTGPVAGPESRHPGAVADAEGADAKRSDPVDDAAGTATPPPGPDPDPAEAESGPPDRGSRRGDADEAGAAESGSLARSARENAEAEALDVVLSEAVRIHGRESVYEIDTTDRPPEAVAADVEAVLAGDRDPSAGDVDYIDYL